MTRDRRLAGVGGIAFAVSLVVGFTLFGPKGGRYSAAEIASFLAQTSGSFIISIGLFVISVTGLTVLMAYLSDASFGGGRLGRVSWATTLLAAASFLIGWGLYLAPASSISSGGPATDPGVTYAFLNAGMVVLFGVGGIALGIALVTLAAGGRAAPVWVRALTGLAGISALLTWAFLVALEWSPNQWLRGRSTWSSSGVWSWASGYWFPPTGQIGWPEPVVVSDADPVAHKPMVCRREAPSPQTWGVPTRATAVRRSSGPIPPPGAGDFSSARPLGNRRFWNGGPMARARRGYRGGRSDRRPRIARREGGRFRGARDPLTLRRHHAVDRTKSPCHSG